MQARAIQPLLRTIGTPGCPCGSVVEHSLGKGEVGSSILPMGTTPFYLFLPLSVPGRHVSRAAAAAPPDLAPSGLGGHHAALFQRRQELTEIGFAHRYAAQRIAQAEYLAVVLAGLRHTLANGGVSRLRA